MRQGAALTAFLLIVSGCSTDKRTQGAQYLQEGDSIRTRGSYRKALVLYEKGIKVDARNDELYWRAGEAARELKQWDKAVSYLHRAISLRPDRIEPYTEAANIYIFAYGATPPAQQAAILRELSAISDELQKRFPNTFEAARVAGYVDLLSPRRTEPALAHFLRARDLRPDDQEMLARCVELLVASGQVAKAEALAALAKQNDARAPGMYEAIASDYLRAHRTADVERIALIETKNHPNLADGYLMLGALQFSTRRWPEMLATVGRVGSLGPLGPYAAGDFLLRVGDVARARQQYEAGAARGGTFQAAYQKRLVEVLPKQGQLADAERIIRALLKADPKDQEALALQATLALAKGDPRTAVSQFRPLLLNMNEDFVLRFLYGRALLATGDLAGAVQQFTDTLKLRGDYIWPRIALAHITIDAGKYGETLLLADALVKVDAVNVPFDTAGQRPQERPFYDTVLNIRPNGGLPLSQLAAKMADAGIGLELALAMAESARTASSNDEIAANLAAVYTRVNKLDAAMDLIKPVVERNPDRTIFHYRLAEVLLRKGNKASADKECEAALRAQGSEKEKTRAAELLRKTG